MYEKEKLQVIFVFRAKINKYDFVLFTVVNIISFSSAFSFTAEMKNAFRSASSIHHKKVLVL